MKYFLAAAAALLFCPVAAFAQSDPVEPVKLVETVSPSLPVRSAPLALALDMALGATVWARVEISTAGPVADVTKLVRQGYYKLEIIQMLLMSAEAKMPLQKTVAKRKSGARLSEIAAEYKLDYEALYERALAVQEILDREYLPRLYRRKTRKKYIDP